MHRNATVTLVRYGQKRQLHVVERRRCCRQGSTPTVTTTTSPSAWIISTRELHTTTSRNINDDNNNNNWTTTTTNHNTLFRYYIKRNLTTSNRLPPSKFTSSTVVVAKRYLHPTFTTLFTAATTDTSTAETASIKEDNSNNNTTTATGAAAAATSEDADTKRPSTVGGPPMVDGVKQYSTPELTADAARHKAGLDDPSRPDWQNPLHHNNPDMAKIFREDFDSDEAFEAAINPAPPLAAAAEDGTTTTTAAPQYLHELADEMVHLTMLEMNELINRISDHYGFYEGMLNPDGGDGDDTADDDDATAAPAAAAAEKTTFDVKLVSYDAGIKIKIIKEVRVIVPGLGLKEAKEMVEGAPVTLQKGVSKDVADQIKAKLEELGAVMEVV